MIFIFSTERGPLQYAGIALLLIQLLSPSTMSIQELSAHFQLRQVVAIIGTAIIGTTVYRARQRNNDGGGRGLYEHFFGNSSENVKLSKIIQMIQSLPMEEFVSNDDYGNCKISQLKQMLAVRNSDSQSAVFMGGLERHQLEQAVKDRRNFCDTCSICHEEYQPGDLLRVLPNCRHEFHLECIDQWAFTFSNANKCGRNPSCPLCNKEIQTTTNTEEVGCRRS